MRTRIAPLAIAGLGLLTMLNVWLGGTLVWEIAFDRPAPAGATAGAPTMSFAGDDVVIANPIDLYKEALARPAFFKSRQPYAPPPPPPAAPLSRQVVAPPPVVDPGFMIGGVVIEGDLKKAFLMSKARPQGMWVMQGEEFLGWTLQFVQGAGATLQRHNQTIEVLLYP